MSADGRYVMSPEDEAFWRGLVAVTVRGALRRHALRAAHHGPKPHPPIKPNRTRTHRRTQR